MNSGGFGGSGKIDHVKSVNVKMGEKIFLI